MSRTDPDAPLPAARDHYHRGEPEGRRPRGAAGPKDLERSRRVGLRRAVCEECGAPRFNVGDSITQHSVGCSVPNVWVKQRTRPLLNGEQSTDDRIGWLTVSPLDSHMKALAA